MKKILAAVFCGFFGLATTILLITPLWANFQIGDSLFDGLKIGPLSVSATLGGQTAAVVGPHDSTGLFGILLIATVLAAAGLMITISVKSLILKKDASKQIKLAKMAMGAAFLSSILFATLTSVPGEYDASGEDVQVTDTAGLDTGEEEDGDDAWVKRQAAGAPVIYAILSIIGLISLTILTGSGSSTSEETETETETPPSDGDANEPAAASEPATEEAPQRDIKKTLNLVFTVIVVCILAYTVLSN
jgi:hypothetical protein